MQQKYNVVIVGAGTAGIMTAAKLRKEKSGITIAIVDPADTHYYQPAWTLVGAGTYDYNKTARPMASLIPSGVTWIKESVSAFEPDKNSIHTSEGSELSYDYLVVCPGLVMEPSMIEGLPEALNTGVALSNYTDSRATWSALQKFKGGNALFTQPSTPIKCGGAPQKTAYLAADYFRKNSLTSKTNVIFATPGTVIFGVKEIKETLEKVVARYGILFRPLYNPVKIDSQNRTVHFKYMGEGAPEISSKDSSIGISINDKYEVVVPFDFLHLAPPQAAPKFVRDSSLVNAAGWLDVDHNSMLHNKYNNIFGLGDVAALPTAKTGAAIRKQVPVVVHNIIAMLGGSQQIADKSYNGYSSCPLVTGYGKMTLAEFDYKNNFTPDPKLKQLLIFDSSKEHWRLWMLKKYGLPYLYWNKMLKGVDV